MMLAHPWFLHQISSGHLGVGLGIIAAFWMLSLILVLLAKRFGG